MLDIERGVDVDALVEQLLDILPALPVAAARQVRVRELVEHEQRRAAPERGLHVEFVEAAAAGQAALRQDFEPLEQRRRLGPAVRLGQSHHDIHPGLEPLLRLLQHGVGLAHARAGAEKDLEAASAPVLLLLLQGGQQCVRVGPFVALFIVHSVSSSSVGAGCGPGRFSASRRPASSCPARPCRGRAPRRGRAGRAPG